MFLQKSSFYKLTILTGIFFINLLFTATTFAGDSFYGDFNGDGFVDVAQGFKNISVNSKYAAGVVKVAYGSTTGMSETETWHQDSIGIIGTAEVGDSFGNSIAITDLNNDGYDDLVVGVPSEGLNYTADVGMIHVIHGSASGLTAEGNQVWHQDSAGISGVNEAYDYFGETLEIGDFNGDGYVDLIVGAIHESIGGIIGAGKINVIYGSASGLTAEGNQEWHQNTEGLPGSGPVERNSSFGYSTKINDLNNDGYDDLIVIRSNQDIDDIENAGAIYVIYGSGLGLTADGSQIWHQNSEGIRGAAEENDYFGRTVEIGDLNNDGYNDLVVGVPNEDIGNVENAGMIHVIYGSGLGLIAEGNQVWHQDSTGIRGAIEARDYFGSSIKIGDLNNDGNNDLVIGVPSENIGNIQYAGMIHVIYGSLSGLTAEGNQVWHQASNGIRGAAEYFDHFGETLEIGDLNNDGYDDLVVASPDESIGNSRAGMVHVIYGSPLGLTAEGNQVWHRNSEGILGTVESSNEFGTYLTIIDLNNDGYNELSIACYSSFSRNGDGINLIYGSTLGLRPEGNEWIFN